MLPDLNVDVADVGMLVAPGGEPDAAQRAEIVKLIDIVYSAIGQAARQGLQREFFSFWTDQQLGQGALFKSINNGIHTVLHWKNRLDSQGMRLFYGIDEAISRFRPGALAIQVELTARDLNEAEDVSKLLSPYVSLHDTLSTTGCSLIWDLRSNIKTQFDATRKVENDVQVMAIFQDAGLDPSGWILTLPNDRAATAILTGRAHIDDRDRVVVCFCSNRTVEERGSYQDVAHHQLDPWLERAMIEASTMPGNIRIALGASALAAPLRMYLKKNLTSEETTDAIASKFVRAGQLTLGMQVST